MDKVYREKKIPLRKCCVCGGMKEKQALLRIVRTLDGEFLLDMSQKMQGRGAYVCREGDCLSQLQKKKGLERSFKCRIGNEVYISLAGLSVSIDE